MIYQKYDYTLELNCDGCGKFKRWRNKGEYPQNNMKGNVLKAKSEGWSIIKTTCKCPECKLNKRSKG